MKFPPRSKTSDAYAEKLYHRLQNAGVTKGNRNSKMVTVITGKPKDPGDLRIIVATSGITSGKNLDKSLNRMQSVEYSVHHFSGASNLALPFQCEDFPIDANLPYSMPGERLCSEPKAIGAAMHSEFEVSGMTTFWWGGRPNPYPDPDNNGKGIFAQPCPVCQQNEEYIMHTLSNEKVGGLCRTTSCINGGVINYFRSSSLFLIYDEIRKTTRPYSI